MYKKRNFKNSKSYNNSNRNKNSNFEKENDFIEEIFSTIKEEIENSKKENKNNQQNKSEEKVKKLDVSEWYMELVLSLISKWYSVVSNEDNLLQINIRWNIIQVQYTDHSRSTIKEVLFVDEKFDAKEANKLKWKNNSEVEKFIETFEKFSSYFI